MHAQYVQTNELYNQCPQWAVKLYRASVAGFYREATEHDRPWKERQWPDWDAVTETTSFAVKFPEPEWRISRSWMDYVKIMESFKSKMEEDSLAIITYSVSLSLCLSASLLPGFSFSFSCSVACMHACKHTHIPFSFFCSALSLFSASSQRGNAERNLHRKQSPIRIALFMSRHYAAYKKGENARTRRWAESGLTDTFLHLQASNMMHMNAWTHMCTHIPKNSIHP